MEDAHINELKSKIDKAKISIEEIKTSYNNIISNSSLQEVDHQLYEVNRAVTNLQNSNIPVPDALRELKNEMTNKLIVKTEANDTINSFIQSLSAFIAELEIKNKSKKKKVKRLDEIASIDIVVDVINAVAKTNQKPSQAFRSIAKKNGISTAGVRLKCTKQIVLTMNSFKSSLTNNQTAIIDQLVKVFPTQEAYIKSKSELKYEINRN